MPANSNTPSPSDPAGSAVDWDSRYRTGETPWDKGSAHPALVEWLKSHPMAGRILVPGCGRGHDVRALAGNPNAQPIGFDLSPTALSEAETFPKTGQEEYTLGDFFTPPTNWPGTFDATFEHTCFCAIDPSLRPAYVEQAARLLKPDGDLLGIFFLNVGDGEGPPFGATHEEIKTLFSPHFTFLEEQSDIPTYLGREGCEVLLHLKRTQGA